MIKVTAGTFGTDKDLHIYGFVQRERGQPNAAENDPSIATSAFTAGWEEQSFSAHYELELVFYSFVLDLTLNQRSVGSTLTDVYS